MALFKCNMCNRTYEDYYPPDDTCTKCKSGTVSIVKFVQKVLSTKPVDTAVFVGLRGMIIS